MEIPFVEKINRMTYWQLDFLKKTDNEFIQDLISVSEVKYEYKKRFLSNLKRGQDSGEVRADISLELVYLIVDKLQELVQDGSWKSVTPDFGSYAEQLRTILFFGLLSRTPQNS